VPALAKQSGHFERINTKKIASRSALTTPACAGSGVASSVLRSPPCCPLCSPVLYHSTYPDAQMAHRPRKPANLVSE